MDDSVRGADFVLRMRERVRGGMREPARELNHLFAEVLDAIGKGRISDVQAQRLFEDIQARRDRESREGMPLGAALPAIKIPVSDSEPKAVPAPESEFQIAERERREKRIRRRRYLAKACSMPRQLAEFFTMAEQAVLSQVVIRWADHGRCDLAVATLAARANVSERTVQSTIRKAKHLNLLDVQPRRRMTTILKIASELWRKWIKAAPSRTENQKCPLLEESMDPPKGAKNVRQPVSEGSKTPAKLDHSAALSGEVDVLVRAAPAPRPKRIERATTPTVDDRLEAARALVEETANSRPTSDEPDEWEKPKAESWMTKRDRDWLSNWQVAERLDPRRYPNMVTDRGAVHTDVLNWLSRRWGSAGDDLAYGIHRFMRGSKPEIRIGFNAREKVTEFAAHWGRAVTSSRAGSYGATFEPHHRRSLLEQGGC